MSAASKGCSRKKCPPHFRSGEQEMPRLYKFPHYASVAIQFTVERSATMISVVVFIVALVLLSTVTSASSFGLESSSVKIQRIREFEDFAIEVKLNGSEGLNLTWFGPGGRVLKENYFTAIIKDQNKTRLEVWGLKRHQSGNYSLLASDGKISQWVNVTVIVKVIPLVDEPVHCEVPLTVGRESIDSCQVTSSQQRDIRWHFNTCQVSVIVDSNPHRTFDQCGELLNMTGVQRKELLWKASKSGELTTVQLLLQLGTDPSMRDQRDFLTPLHLAVEFGRLEVARELIAAGSDLEARNNDGRTPLHLAVYKKRVEVARVLIAAGSDLEARDNNETTPLHLAASTYMNGCEDICRLLLDSGAKLKPLDKYKQNPLFFN